MYYSIFHFLTTIVSLQVHWLRLNIKQAPTNEEVIVLCRRLLANLDTLVQITIGKFGPSTRCFSFTSGEEIIIKGRCRDYSALANNVLDQKDVQFVCIAHLLPAAHSTVEHTIQAHTAHNASQLHSIGYCNIKRLIELLTSVERNTRVVFCCDAVNDDAMQLLAQSGLYLVR